MIVNLRRRRAIALETKTVTVLIRKPFACCTDRCTLPACRRAIQLRTQEHIFRRYWTRSRRAMTCNSRDGGGRSPRYSRPRGTRCFAASTPILPMLTERFSVAMHLRRSGWSLASFPRFGLKTRDVAFGYDAQVSARHDHCVGPRGEDSEPPSCQEARATRCLLRHRSAGLARVGIRL
jgi:hypothetical protein